MSYQTIISIDDLNQNLSNDNWYIFDCRFSLKDPNEGFNKFNQGHIPGAQFANMDNDLSSPKSESSGRHPLPNPDIFIQKLRDWGVNNDSQIVCYDDVSGAYAARMWWLLYWLGHQDVAVLDGGIEKWIEKNFPIETEVKQRSLGSFSGMANDDMWVDIGFVEQQLEQGQITLLDARPATRFTAEDQKTDPVPGHIPGAINYPFADNLDQQGMLLPAEELRQRFTQIFATNQQKQIINMCGSGVTACHNLLAMNIAGFPMPRLYVGSWSEWIRDQNRPVATKER